MFSEVFQCAKICASVVAQRQRPFLLSSNQIDKKFQQQDATNLFHWKNTWRGKEVFNTWMRVDGVSPQTLENRALWPASRASLHRPHWPGSWNLFDEKCVRIYVVSPGNHTDSYRPLSMYINIYLYHIILNYIVLYLVIYIWIYIIYIF